MDLTKLATRLIFYKVNTHSHKIPSRKGPLRVMHERVSPPPIFLFFWFSHLYIHGDDQLFLSPCLSGNNKRKLIKGVWEELALN